MDTLSKKKKKCKITTSVPTFCERMIGDPFRGKQHYGTFLLFPCPKEIKSVNRLASLKFLAPGVSFVREKSVPLQKKKKSRI